MPQRYYNIRVDHWIIQQGRYFVDQINSERILGNTEIKLVGKECKKNLVSLSENQLFQAGFLLGSGHSDSQMTVV